jgi:hypothetical protein
VKVGIGTTLLLDPPQPKPAPSLPTKPTKLLSHAKLEQKIGEVKLVNGQIAVIARFEQLVGEIEPAGQK